MRDKEKRTSQIHEKNYVCEANKHAPADRGIAHAGLEEDQHVIILTGRQQKIAKRLRRAQQRAEREAREIKSTIGRNSDRD